MNGSLRWFDFLFPPRADEKVIRDVSVDEFLLKLAPSLVPDTRPACVTLLPFHDPSVRSALHEAKYHGSQHAFQLLASALAEYLRDADDLNATRFNLGNSDLRLNLVALVPVPLGRERREKRGFNQVEEVARRAAEQLAAPSSSLWRRRGGALVVDASLLVRTRETISQVSLPREEREKNMRGAFLASPKLEERRRAGDASSYTYILIDDVITTGATLQSAIDALKEAGASHIIPLALAH